MKCQARQESDQYVCHHCGVCWDISDTDPPICKNDQHPESDEPTSTVVTYPAMTPGLAAAHARAEVNRLLSSLPEEEAQP